jgi:hypothetical protein
MLPSSMSYVAASWTALSIEASPSGTTRHPHLPHCESSGLLESRDRPGFEEAVSRDHVVVIYGGHQHDCEILAGVLG